MNIFCRYNAEIYKNISMHFLIVHKLQREFGDWVAITSDYLGIWNAQVDKAHFRALESRMWNPNIFYLFVDTDFTIILMIKNDDIKINEIDIIVLFDQICIV